MIKRLVTRKSHFGVWVVARQMARVTVVAVPLIYVTHFRAMGQNG